MEAKPRFTKPSLYDRAWWISRVVFGYNFPLFYQGVKNHGLNFADLHRCPQDDEAEKLFVRLRRHWNNEKRSKTPRFWWALAKTYAAYFILPFLVYFIEECVLRIVQPLLLGGVIRFFSENKENPVTYSEACWYAAGVTACTAFFISIHHPTMLYVMRIGMRLRTSCCSLMYQKALRLSRASVGQTAVGQIVNIMSNDVNRMDEFAIFVSYLIVAPIQTAICIYIVYGYLGWSTFVGIALLLLFIPFQALMGRLFSRVRLATAILTDTRLRYMNEIISGMRVIKMYSWELPFAKRVAQARSAEVSRVRQACYLKAINLSLFFVATRIILFVCFVTYVLTSGQLLNAEAVFVSMALLNTLRLTMTFFFPQAISLGSELNITCKRIENFLLLEEMSTIDELDALYNTPSPKKKSKAKKMGKSENVYSVASKSKQSTTKANLLDSNLSNSNTSVDSSATAIVETSTKKTEQACLIMNNISAKWSPDIIQPTLKDISVRLKPGDLLAVIGPVGSGKSSFLMTLLKELPYTAGSIDLVGSLSYASQDAWSFNDSVRNNILFGLPYNEAKYQEVIRVCALERDLTLMPFGDRTLVGEKGVSLSGGQKARINLARAVYRDADICLLDDPLSAVDTSVAEHIFEKCINEYLRNKIRILVTHQIQFIQKATKILVLTEGNCLACGTFTELHQMGIDFVSLLAEPEGGDGLNEEDRDRSMSRLSIESSGSSLNLSTTAGRPRTLSTGVESYEVVPSGNNEEEVPKEVKVVEEQFQRGSIKCRIYKEYLKAGAGPISLFLTTIFTIASQAIFSGSDLFLTAWTNKNQLEGSKDDQNVDIAIYAALIASLFITTILRSITFFIICMRASKNLHNNIFERLLRAPVAFFDNNPAGRILNRFTKDLGIIDEMLPNTAYDLNLIFTQAIGIVVTVSIVNWYLVLPALFLAIVIYYVRGIYIISARDIKRFEGLARSPVYSHVSTTINGLASIRAFGAQRSFEKQFYVYQNDHSATWFLFISTSRTMGLVMDWVSTLYIAVISIAIMLSTENIAGGDAGLAISSGLMLAGMTQWGVRQSAEFESQMTSVERIVEYNDLEKEAPAESDEHNKPAKGWPAEGAIEFDRMCLTYSKDAEKPVLKNIQCSIYGGEKIGIVGRTGAGKSSMIAALFRLTEPTGTIRIDGVDIQTIGLNDLRKAVSIIPQDPVVFSGTVRYNLDPFSEYSDDALWSALEQVQLKAQVSNYTGKLEARLSESGGNLSVGQRQLICLARAILRQNKILILDEATANVDHQTDSLIQSTIRAKFATCTVLTIAHRLNTIIDCDRVLVLDAGEIVEFDVPYQLLKNRGIFHDMCKKTGPSMFSHLYQLAKITHQAKLRALLNRQDSAIAEEDPLLITNNEIDPNDQDDTQEEEEEKGKSAQNTSNLYNPK